MKKSLILIIILMLVGLLVLNACTKKAEKPPEEKRLKVAAAFVLSVEEPWDGVIHTALEKASKDLDFDYEMTENIGYPDYERVLREYANRGFNVIFGDAFGSEEAVRRVAKDFPNVAFVFGSALGPAEPNFAVFDDWIHEPAYLCGMIAGKMTKTNVIGMVAGFPNSECNRILNAFILGAKEVNPKVKAKVTFIGSWFDPPKAKEAAIAQIEAGADFIFAERYGVIEACQEKKVYAFGCIDDQNYLAPDWVITSAVWDMYPTVKYVIEAVKNGSFKAMDLKDWTMMAKGGAKLAPFYGFEQKLPKEIIEMVKKREQEILDGLFRVPIEEQTPKSDF